MSERLCTAVPLVSARHRHSKRNTHALFRDLCTATALPLLGSADLQQYAPAARLLCYCRDAALGLFSSVFPKIETPFFRPSAFNLAACRLTANDGVLALEKRWCFLSCSFFSRSLSLCRWSNAFFGQGKTRVLAALFILFAR